MALADEVAHGSAVAFDTNAFIYYVEMRVPYHAMLRPLFERVTQGNLQGHASALSLLEVLVKPLTEENLELAERYRSILRDSQFITLHPADAVIAERAADIRSRLNLSVADSIIAATAIEGGCSHLIVNDRAFRRVDGVEVLILDDFVA